MRKFRFVSCAVILAALSVLPQPTLAAPEWYVVESPEYPPTTYGNATSASSTASAPSGPLQDSHSYTSSTPTYVRFIYMDLDNPQSHPDPTGPYPWVIKHARNVSGSVESVTANGGSARARLNGSALRSFTYTKRVVNGTVDPDYAPVPGPNGGLGGGTSLETSSYYVNPEKIGEDWYAQVQIGFSIGTAAEAQQQFYQGSASATSGGAAVGTTGGGAGGNTVYLEQVLPRLG